MSYMHFLDTHVTQKLMLSIPDTQSSQLLDWRYLQPQNLEYFHGQTATMYITGTEVICSL